MPILVNDFTWTQSNENVYINVPLKGINCNRVDVFISEQYVKLHFKPFIFEVFLKYAIDDKNAICRLTKTEAHLDLPKMHLFQWDSLQASLNPNEKKIIRSNAMNRYQMQCAQNRENRNSLRAEQDKFTVSQAIDYDTQRRNRIQEQMNNEKNKVMKELDEWKEKTEYMEIDDPVRDRTLKISVNNSEIIVENELWNRDAYKNTKFVDETFELNFDNDGMWVTNLPRLNDKPRNLYTLMEDSKLYESTSAEILFSKDGVTIESSVDNDTLICADPYEGRFLYETQAITKDEANLLPDFGTAGPVNDIVFKAECGDSQAITAEHSFNKDSSFILEPESYGYSYTMEGITDDESEYMNVNAINFMIDKISDSAGIKEDEFLVKDSEAPEYDDIEQFQEEYVPLETVIEQGETIDDTYYDQTRFVTPIPYSTSPTFRTVTPQPSTVSPKPRMISQQSRVVTPQSRVVTPQSCVVTPQSHIASPQSRMVFPQEIVSQQLSELSATTQSSVCKSGESFIDSRFLSTPKSLESTPRIPEIIQQQQPPRQIIEYNQATRDPQTSAGFIDSGFTSMGTTPINENIRFTPQNFQTVNQCISASRSTQCKNGLIPSIRKTFGHYLSIPRAQNQNMQHISPNIPPFINDPSSSMRPTSTPADNTPANLNIKSMTGYTGPSSIRSYNANELITPEMFQNVQQRMNVCKSMNTRTGESGYGSEGPTRDNPSYIPQTFGSPVQCESGVNSGTIPRQTSRSIYSNTPQSATAVCSNQPVTPQNTNARMRLDFSSPNMAEQFSYAINNEVYCSPSGSVFCPVRVYDNVRDDDQLEARFHNRKQLEVIHEIDELEYDSQLLEENHCEQGRDIDQRQNLSSREQEKCDIQSSSPRLLEDGNVYIEEDEREYRVDRDGLISERSSTRGIYSSPGQICQQIAVDIRSDETGTHTMNYQRFTDCNQKAEDEFISGDIFKEPRNYTLGKVLLETLPNQDLFARHDTKLESLLKEQQDLLQDHIQTTEKRFDVLTKKIENCEKLQQKVLKPNVHGSGDNSNKLSTVERKTLSKNDKTTKIAEKKIDSNKGSISKNDKGSPRKKEVTKTTGAKKFDKLKKNVPPPRKTQTMQVYFTERIFPTPQRESSAKVEEEWLKNVMECKRATGFVSEDLRPEEQDPEWCKKKGDTFYKSGNHLGAISAYSHGIKLCSKMPSLYSNRAACHLALGNYTKCLEDCSLALDLLKPPCPSNLDSRAKCIARRAVALTRMGMLSKAIDEMKAALRLQPDNLQLKSDLHFMERAWEQDPDSD